MIIDNLEFPLASSNPNGGTCMGNGSIGIHKSSNSTGWWHRDMNLRHSSGSLEDGNCQWATTHNYFSPLSSIGDVDLVVTLHTHRLCHHRTIRPNPHRRHHRSDLFPALQKAEVCSSNIVESLWTPRCHRTLPKPSFCFFSPTAFRAHHLGPF